MSRFNSGYRYNTRTNYNSAPVLDVIRDYAAGTDIAFLGDNVAISSDDGGRSGDTAEFSVSAPLNETGTGTETVWFGAVYPVIDSLLGQDTVNVRYILMLDEAGAGSDTNAPGITAMSMTDMGAGGDVIIKTGSIPVTDRGLAHEAPDADAGIGLIDSAGGFDAINLSKTYYMVTADNTLWPLNVKVLRDSEIDLMPEIKFETDSIPGRPGEVYFDSKLGARVIELKVLANGFTIEEREGLKRNLARYLNPVDGVKPVVFADDLEKQYLVKYAGKIEVNQYPNWMELVIPFKSASPYIQGAFEIMQEGSGTLTNAGNTETPLTIQITGPVTNPSVVISPYTLTYTGSVNAGSQLTIDTEKLTVELDGANVLPNYSGGFPWLAVGDTAVAGAAGGTTTFRYRGRWL